MKIKFYYICKNIFILIYYMIINIDELSILVNTQTKIKHLMNFWICKKIYYND